MEDCSLNWNEYGDHLKNLMIKMITTTEYSDVTLVCDDSDFQFKTHKSVISACSPELEKIIRKTTEKNPIIYLRGVPSKEMEALIQFMYLGRTTVNQKDLPELLKVAQDLKIKGIGHIEAEKGKNAEKRQNTEDEIMIIDKSITEDKRMNESDATESPFQIRQVTSLQNKPNDTLDNLSVKRGRGRPRKVDIIQNKPFDTLEENVLFDNHHENKSLSKSLDFTRTIKNAMTKVNKEHDSSFEFSFEQTFSNGEKTKNMSPMTTPEGSENVVGQEENSQPAKRGRGRPKNVKNLSDSLPVKRGRGRPRKVDIGIKEVSTKQEDVFVNDPLAEENSTFLKSNITV